MNNKKALKKKQSNFSKNISNVPIQPYVWNGHKRAPNIRSSSHRNSIFCDLRMNFFILIKRKLIMKIKTKILLLNTVLFFICVYSYQSDQKEWYERYKNLSVLAFLANQVPSIPLSPVRIILLDKVRIKNDFFTREHTVIVCTVGYGQMRKSTVVIISLCTYFWIVLLVLSVIRSFVYHRSLRTAA